VPDWKEGRIVGYATAPEHSFEFGLKVILDGLEHELAARRRTPHSEHEHPGRDS
jgi:hypothetical protein